MLKRCFSTSLNTRFPIQRGVGFLTLLTLGTGALLHGERVTATVKEIDTDQQRIVVETAGAERSFQIGRGDAQILEVGDAIAGETARQGEGWRLEKIFPSDPDEVAVIERLGEQLQRETLRRGFKAFRAVGERVPRFALWDQHGDLFLSETLRGNYVVLNFVFTRCTMPEMCSAATVRMQQLGRMLDEKDWDDVKLVSITLDPAYDTPGVWTAYAEDRGLDSSRHYLLGGPTETVNALKKQMGVLAEPDDNQIVRHTMSTALIDPTGKVIYRIPGSRWDPSVFLQQIEKDRAGNQD